MQTKNEELKNLRPHGKGYAWDVSYQQRSVITGELEQVTVSYNTATTGKGLYFTCRHGVRSRVNEARRTVLPERAGNQPRVHRDCTGLPRLRESAV